MRITAGNNLLFISPWRPDLSKILTMTRVERDADGNTIMKPEALYSLCEVNGIQSGYVPAGLWSRLHDYLRRSGMSYTFVEDRPDLPTPDFDKLDFQGFRPGQDQALLALSSSYGGIIEAATGYGKTFLMVQIAKMYPDQEIVMTTARKQVVMTIYERLMAEPSLAGQVGVICSDKNTGPDFRIVVSTVRSLWKTNADRCDILLADECHNFGAEEASSSLALFSTARRFGFSASPTGRSDKADLLVEAMFGGTLFSFSYQESVSAGAVVPIEVHVYSIAKGSSKDYDDPVAVKRHGFWRNYTRNLKIAEVATRHAESGDQVLILCDTIDHVMHIKRLLPKAVAVYSNCSKKRYEESYVSKGFTSDPHLTSKGVSKIRKGLESGEIKLCVSTMIFKEGIDFTHLACLIRADGGSSDINNTQLPGRLSRTVDGKTIGVLVDFMDVFDKRLRRKSLKRLSFYKKKGWKVKHENQF